MGETDRGYGRWDEEKGETERGDDENDMGIYVADRVEGASVKRTGQTARENG